MTQQEVERLINQLESFAKAYPESVFAPVTDAEIRDFPSLITRNSAAMGRHMGKWMQRAADALRALTVAPPTDNPVLWLRMLGDTPDWGEDCCHVDADGLSLDTYNDELDPTAAEKYWALPLYRKPAAPPTEGAIPRAATTVTDADLGEIARFAGTKNDAARLTHKLTTDAAPKATEGATMAALLRECRDAMDCREHDDSHWCNKCDGSVDRGTLLRHRIDAILASPIAPPTEQKEGK